MVYCTRVDIERLRLPSDELNAKLDDESIGPDNEKIEERLSAIIVDVNSKIDIYLLAGGFTLPLPSVPTMLVGIAADMAASGVSSRRGGEEDKTSQSKYNNAIKLLEQIRDEKKEGKDLLFPPPPKAASTTFVLVNKTDSDREFSDSKLAQMP